MQCILTVAVLPTRRVPARLHILHQTRPVAAPGVIRAHALVLTPRAVGILQPDARGAAVCPGAALEGNGLHLRGRQGDQDRIGGEHLEFLHGDVGGEHLESIIS